MQKLKVGDVVKTNSDCGGGYWKIVLDVTQKHLEDGINSDHIGLHLFYGMWYGDNPFDIGSFGKIEELPSNEPRRFLGLPVDGTEFEYIGHIDDINFDEFKQKAS